MKLLESGIEDYWSQWGWNTDISMAVDSKIFFQENNTKLILGDSVKIGGTAQDGSTQPWSDNNYLNGTNALPSITISVEEGN